MVRAGISGGSSTCIYKAGINAKYKNMKRTSSEENSRLMIIDNNVQDLPVYRDVSAPMQIVIA